jgi:hypothetical protein
MPKYFLRIRIRGFINLNHASDRRRLLSGHFCGYWKKFSGIGSKLFYFYFLIRINIEFFQRFLLALENIVMFGSRRPINNTDTGSGTLLLEKLNILCVTIGRTTRYILFKRIGSRDYIFLMACIIKSELTLV